MNKTAANTLQQLILNVGSRFTRLNLTTLSDHHFIQFPTSTPEIDYPQILANVISIIIFISPIYLFSHSLKNCFINGQKNSNLLISLTTGWISSNTLMNQNHDDIIASTVVFASIPLAFYLGTKFPTIKTKRSIGTQTFSCN